jgi:FKBP-type peptidyl-prolyl cis-trans isomerase
MSTRAVLLTSLLILPAFVIAQQESVPKSAADKDAPVLETNQQRASYAIGFNIGSDLKRQGLEVDFPSLTAGIATALAGKARALSDEEVQKCFAELRATMQKKAEAKAAENLAAGRKFLEANKTKDGVKVTGSGLQYIVLKEGTGATPTTGSTVSTHYRGTLIDGTVFDSSYAGDAPVAGEEPVSFGVTQVIAGWTEALQLMKVGSKYRLFIPSELAYGESGPDSIGPNSVLIFDIELISSK